MSANDGLPAHDVHALEYAFHRYKQCPDRLDFRDGGMTVFVQGDYQRFTIDFSLRDFLDKISMVFSKEKKTSRKPPELCEVSVGKYQLSPDEIAQYMDQIHTLIQQGSALIRKVLDERKQTIRSTFEKLAPQQKELAKLA